MKIIMKNLIKNAIAVLIMIIISVASSLFLFATVFDSLLLWQFDGGWLYGVLRLLLALVIFQVLWGIYKGRIPKMLIWILGIFYTAVILFITLTKSPNVRSINLNPFSIIADFNFISFYVIANFLCFIPIGMFAKYTLPNSRARYLYAGGFLGSFVIEIVQYIFWLGVADINDVLLNGLGFGLGIVVLTKLSKSQRASNVLSI